MRGWCDSFGELSTEPRCAFERVVGPHTNTIGTDPARVEPVGTGKGDVTGDLVDRSRGDAVQRPLYVRDDPERECRSTNGSRRYSGSGRP
jgi:hypothetical protein